MSESQSFKLAFLIIYFDCPFFLTIDLENLIDAVRCKIILLRAGNSCTVFNVGSCVRTDGRSDVNNVKSTDLRILCPAFTEILRTLIRVLINAEGTIKKMRRHKSLSLS